MPKGLDNGFAVPAELAAPDSGTTLLAGGKGVREISTNVPERVGSCRTPVASDGLSYVDQTVARPGHVVH